MSSLVDFAVRRLVSTGFRRGLRGSNPWLVAGIGALGVRTVRRLARPEPEVLYRTRLRAGDRFEVEATAPASGRRGRGR